MTSSGPRFCPRCGTARVGDMAFCPKCGLDLRDLPADEGAVREAPDAAVETRSAPALPSVRRDERNEGSMLGRLLVPGLVVLALLLAVAWFGGLGPFGRGASPVGGGAGQNAMPSSPYLAPVTSQPSVSLAPGLTATPVGLTILSPADGTVVGSPRATVIGIAPPGLGVTQDVSFGLDHHATADGTGHWAIEVELKDGENQLRFRIGDDPSTLQTIRVIYLKPAS